MPKTIGYTPKQAERSKHRIDNYVARIEDICVGLRSVVPDTTPYFEGALDEIREQAAAMKAVIDRRTQK